MKTRKRGDKRKDDVVVASQDEPNKVVQTMHETNVAVWLHLLDDRKDLADDRVADSGDLALKDGDKIEQDVQHNETH